MERMAKGGETKGVCGGGEVSKRGQRETRAQVIFYLIVEEERMGRVSQQGDQRQTEGDRDGEVETQRREQSDPSLGETPRFDFSLPRPSYLPANIPKPCDTRTLFTPFCSKEGRR